VVYESRMNSHHQHLASRLRELIGARGISQADLAARLGFPRTKVVKILNGAQLVSDDDLNRIMDAIENLDVDEKTELLRIRHHAAGEARYRLRKREYAYIDEGNRVVVGAENVGTAHVNAEAGEEGDDPIRGYLSNLEGELALVTKHAKRRLLAYRALRFVALVASAVTPAVALLKAAPLLTAGIAALAFLSEGSIQLTRVNDRAVLDTRRVNALNREHRLYRTKVGDYEKAANPFTLLVKRVEAIREENENEQLAVVQQTFGVPKSADKS
jgi:transcriptional regulator with XRE-family HTH domain